MAKEAIIATTSIKIRMDKNIKKQAEALFSKMELNMKTVFTIFTKAVARRNKIPFKIATEPFFNEAKWDPLRKVTKELEAGKD